MQNLSLNEIISLINRGECFEATHNGDFNIKILEYVPYVCVALHDGGNLRPELEEICLLNKEERYYEEDPHTGEMIKSLPITLIGCDSRYEYDLNRNEENCIYDVAWGRKVWKRELTQEEREISLEKHRNFFKVIDALVTKLEKDFGAAIFYDIHSYNFKRHLQSHVFNIGIENIDIKKYNNQISFWKKQLAGIKIRKIKADVSVNHIFYGRGQLLVHIKNKYNNTLVLATEVKKIYMDELTGQLYPMILRDVTKGLKNAIVSNSQYYINTLAKINVTRKSTLLNSEIQPEVLKLDKQLYRILRNFEILSFVNPLNIESEKKRFFKSRFAVNPEFRYKPLTIDPFLFKSRMYSLNVDSIDDIHIRQIYIDIITAYSDKIDIISNIGSDKFLYNSLRYFGEPSAKDIANANFLLYCNELPQFELPQEYDHDEAALFFSTEIAKYGFNFKVEVVSTIASDVLVLNSKQTLLVKKGARFTRARLNALLNHEVGVHAVTTMNAQMQPLKFLSLGLPRNTYTQEGLAILAEMFSGNLTVGRLQELGLRVLAVELLTAGNDFKTTFQQLYEQHHVNPDKLFYLVTRVYRGRGFTKDFLYLRGFRKLLELIEKGTNLNNLFLGKTNHHYLPILNELVDRGILQRPTFKSQAFENPSPIEPILKYLTDCLKDDMVGTSVA